MKDISKEWAPNVGRGWVVVSIMFCPHPMPWQWWVIANKGFSSKSWDKRLRIVFFNWKLTLVAWQFSRIVYFLLGVGISYDQWLMVFSSFIHQFPVQASNLALKLPKRRASVNKFVLSDVLSMYLIVLLVFISCYEKRKSCFIYSCHDTPSITMLYFRGPTLYLVQGRSQDGIWSAISMGYSPPIHKKIGTLLGGFHKWGYPK